MKYILALSLLCVAITSIAQDKQLGLISREPDEINHYHWSIWANYQFRQGQIKPASYWYAKILGNNPSPYALHGYIAALFKAHNYPAIVKLIPMLDNEFANKRDMQLIFAQSLLYTRNVLPAHKRFIEIYTDNPTHSESAYFAAESYSRLKEYDKALELIDTYLKNSSHQHTDFLFHFLKAQIYAMQRHVDKARVQTKKAMELNPRFAQGTLFLQLLDKIEQEIKRTGTTPIDAQTFKKYRPQVQQQSNNFYKTEKNIYFI